MDTVDCNGVSINYRTVGAGKDVVLIHGLGANHAFWHLKVILSLVRQYRVTMYDLRGHGYSSMPTSGYSSADMVQDLHHLLNHLNISQAHLIGHSFGGVVALHYAAIHTHRVHSLTVVDCRVRALQPSNRGKDWPNWRNARKRLEEIGLFLPEDEEESGLWLLDQLALPKWQQARAKLEGSPLFIPFNRWGSGKRSAERWLKLVEITSLRKDIISPDGLTLDKLTSIQQPSMVICGEKSTSIPSFWGLKRLLLNCKTEIIPGVGHFFPLTHPDLFMTIVGGFLESIEDGDRRRHQRLPLKLDVDLRWGGDISFPAVTVDVSNHGILISSPKKLEMDSKVKIITDLNQDYRLISLRGKVVRLNSEDVGTNHQLAIELISEGDGYLAWKNFLAT